MHESGSPLHKRGWHGASRVCETVRSSRHDKVNYEVGGTCFRPAEMSWLSSKFRHYSDFVLLKYSAPYIFLSIAWQVKPFCCCRLLVLVVSLTRSSRCHLIWTLIKWLLFPTLLSVAVLVLHANLYIYIYIRKKIFLPFFFFFFNTEVVIFPTIARCFWRERERERRKKRVITYTANATLWRCANH